MEDQAQGPEESENTGLLVEMVIDEEKVSANVDSIINVLLDPNAMSIMKQLPEMEVIALCRRCKELLLQEPMLLELNTPITVVGDIHGHFQELMKWFNIVGYPDTTNFLFLGNYINRGKYNLETLWLLMCYKIKNPGTFFMLRGNHETLSLSKVYGFFNDCKKRYNKRVYKSFIDVFNNLPIAAIIEDRIFCVHGGLSPDLHSLDQIRKLYRPLDSVEEGMPCDLLWSDPNREDNGWGISERGISCTYGADIVSKFLSKYEFDLICRGHEVVEEGFEFFAKRQLVTLFSVPNYCGEYDNAGAVMCVNDSLQCTIKIIRSKSHKSSKSKITLGNIAY